MVVRDRDNEILHSTQINTLSLKAGKNVISFPISLPAGEFFADLWIKRDGAVLAFGSISLDVISRTGIKSFILSKSSFKKEDDIS